MLMKKLIHIRVIGKSNFTLDYGTAKKWLLCKTVFIDNNNNESKTRTFHEALTKKENFVRFAYNWLTTNAKNL